MIFLLTRETTDGESRRRLRRAFVVMRTIGTLWVFSQNLRMNMSCLRSVVKRRSVSFRVTRTAREGDGSVDDDDGDFARRRFSFVSAPVGTKAPARRIEASV